MSYWESNLLSSGHQEKTSYETWNERKPKVKYFRVFGSKCFILNDRENLGKFDAKSDEGIFLGYSLNSRAYRVYNNRTKTVMESINVVIDDAILEKIIEESGDATNLKKNDDNGNLSQDSDVEKQSLEKETTSISSRRETRSSQVPSSPLTLPEVQPPLSHDDEPSTSKKSSSRVSLNHPKSNIIRDLDEGLHLRRVICMKYIQ